MKDITPNRTTTARTRRSVHDHRGFSLLEIAIVLVILSTLGGSWLTGMRQWQAHTRLQETRTQLDEIREALQGFMLSHGRLPCPDRDSDPLAPGYGEEEGRCDTDATSEGWLPWKTLGVREHDGWGSPGIDAALPARGRWRYRVERNYADPVLAASQLINLQLRNFPTVDALDVYQHVAPSPRLTGGGEYALAIVYSSGANGTPDGLNASYEARTASYATGEPTHDFDDVLIWLSRPLVVSRLASQGLLPAVCP